MSWLGDTFTAEMPTMLQELGAEDVILRRPHTLERRTEPRIVTAMALSGGHAQNATSLTLRNTDSTPIAGVLPQGLVLTIAGHDYPALADVAAVGNPAPTTIVVAIAAPGLAVAASDGAAVAVAAEVLLSFPVSQGGGLRQDLAVREIPTELLDQVSSRISLCRQGAPGAPKPGMLAQFSDGTTARVVRIERDWEGGWDLLVGAA